jgi:hypothetical protein
MRKTKREGRVEGRKKVPNKTTEKTFSFTGKNYSWRREYYTV